MSKALNNEATPSPRKREREATAETRDTDIQKPPTTKTHNNEEETEMARAIVFLEEEAITKKRQGKKNVNAATHDPTTQNYSNKSPTAESYNSDEKDSGEFKMPIADTRETPTAHRETTPGAAGSRSSTDATV